MSSFKFFGFMATFIFCISLTGLQAQTIITDGQNAAISDGTGTVLTDGKIKVSLCQGWTSKDGKTWTDPEGNSWVNCNCEILVDGGLNLIADDTGNVAAVCDGKAVTLKAKDIKYIVHDGKIIQIKKKTKNQ